MTETQPPCLMVWNGGSIENPTMSEYEEINRRLRKEDKQS